jgi:hypothetical protein
VTEPHHIEFPSRLVVEGAGNTYGRFAQLIPLGVSAHLRLTGRNRSPERPTHRAVFLLLLEQFNYREVDFYHSRNGTETTGINQLTVGTIPMGISVRTAKNQGGPIGHETSH